MSAPAVAICSGGLDSSVLAYSLRRTHADLHLLSVNYGQRHVRELDAAQIIARKLGATWRLVDLTAVAPLLSGSALTSSDIPVPEGHYTDSTMAATVVPNRNAILLSLAYGYAVSIGAEVVAIGVHAGDHPVYPDCRPAFISQFAIMEKTATEGFAHDHLSLMAPFVMRTKADIVRMGQELDVPFRDTWSCYAPTTAMHCGRCGTCIERAEAFKLAGVADPTEYADPYYWRTVTHHEVHD